MKITDVDPLQYDLLFERFLNPERVSMPDVDVDFCVRGRAEVIDYVSNLYGKQNVAQIITFGTMASRAVIKDVGRALEMPYTEVEKVAKMIPPPIRGRNVSISDALDQNPDLKHAVNNNEQVAELIETALRLEGNARHTSIHAAGVVISPVPIHELIPVCTGANDELTTQFVMADLDKMGMLKMDFLGLTTLTVIEDCLRTIERDHGSRPDLSKVPLDDEKTLKLFADGHLNAVFQFEGAGIAELCRKMRPRGLEDLSALNALYRPGPLDGGMVDDYINRRHGRKKVTYLVPEMKEILENTYGVLVYQEQIMQLAQRLAGYSLGEADLMRRAMGKKKKEEMVAHEEKFVNGCIARDIAKDRAETIFNLMVQFADYGFNRSHSFAYAYLAYHTAWLKAHYPQHFYAAVLSNESNNTEKLARYVAEMKVFGIQVFPPDVNLSFEGFTPVGDAVRFGLTAIKGLGSSAVQMIIKAREEGAFTSIFDFAARVDSRGVNKRVMESLIKAGAFDETNTNRAVLMAVMDRAIEYGAKSQRDRESGQTDLFAAFAETTGQTDEPTLPDLKPWSRKETLAQEKDALGFYVSGHPLEEFAESLRALATIDAGNFAEQEDGAQVAMGGLIVELATKITKKGDKFALFRLEDQFGSVKIVCWPETYNRSKQLLEADHAVLIKGKLELTDEGQASIIASEIVGLESAHTSSARGMVLNMPESSVNDARLERLGDLLTRNEGHMQIFFDVLTADAQVVRVTPNQFLRVKVTPQLMEGMKDICADWRVELKS